MLHMVVEDAFADLLRCWRDHERRRAIGSSVPDLGGSRRQLDAARSRVHRFRVAMYPDPTEAQSIVERVFCDALEAVVHLRWADQIQDRPGFFACPCGEQIALGRPNSNVIR